MMRRILRTAALAACAVAFGTGLAAAEEVKLRAASFIPKNHPVMMGSNEWTDAVNKALDGKLEVNYVGGPEVIPRPQQFEAVRNGVLDIGFIVTADYQDELPEVSAFVLSRVTSEEERKNGFVDYMTKVHERANMKYLGRIHWSPFYLWVNKEPKSIADLKGLKMRTGSLYDRFMRELGMVPVTMNAPETYTALDRGVVDGFGWPAVGPRKQGWLDKVKYVIDLPFFIPSNVVAVMNLEKFNALPKDVQDALMKVSAEVEPQIIAAFKKQDEDEWKELAGAVKRVKFSEAENKKYLDTAYAVEWAQIEKRIGAEKAAELKKLTGN